MTRNKRKSGRRKIKAQPPNTSKKDPAQYEWVFVSALPYLRPVLFVAVIGLLVSFNRGYDRLYAQNFVRLSNDLNRFSAMTYEERLGIFFPQDYPFLSQVKEKTPSNAIILAPPNSVWHPEDNHLNFSRWIQRKDYMTYFLYPRKIVFDDRGDRDNPLKEHITHVMIVDSWGYDKLPYHVSNPTAFTVLPINPE